MIRSVVTRDVIHLAVRGVILTLIGLFQVCGCSGCGLFDVWKVFITGPEASFVDFHTVTRITQLTTKANELVSSVITVSGF